MTKPEPKPETETEMETEMETPEMAESAFAEEFERGWFTD